MPIQHEEGAKYREMMARHLGPTIMRAFDDPDVTEIYTNPHDQRIRVATRSRGRYDTGEEILPTKVLAFLQTVATSLQTQINAENPELAAELPTDRFLRSRLEGIIPPIAEGPLFVIRKLPALVYSLDQYVEDGALRAGHREVIRRTVRRKGNILVVGATDSGKTTLTNAIMREISEECPQDRILILEDTVELQCQSDDYARLRTNRKLGIELDHLLFYTMRLSPKRIVVGEVRDRAALSLLKAWNTGHPGGVATVHSDAPEGAIHRVDQMCMEANVPSQLSYIAQVLDLIVCIEGVPQEGGGVKRVVREIAEVGGMDRDGCIILRNVTEPGELAAA